jgi:protocatechuate 3,4-dioxygenase, alpha subunit
VGDVKKVVAATASQTVGPFFHVGLHPLFNGSLIGSAGRNQPITIRGRVVDGGGIGVPDAMIEIWQADADGRYPDSPTSEFAGFGRLPTGPDGEFQFTTIKPGRVAAPDGTLQAPHIVVTIFMRGLLRHLGSRIYFPHDPANEQDFVLNLVDTGRQPTLIAREVTPHAFEWNVLLQGDGETVFFEF